MRKILVVEDEYGARAWICTVLKDAFNEAEIDEMATELDFQKRFAKIVADNPDVIIMDMLLAWTSPRRDLQPPPERVKREGFYTAGVRCKEMLDGDDETRSIPVLFYTVLSLADLTARLGSKTETLNYLQKDYNAATLIARVRELVDPTPASELTY